MNFEVIANPLLLVKTQNGLCVCYGPVVPSMDAHSNRVAIMEFQNRSVFSQHVDISKQWSKQMSRCSQWIRVMQSSSEIWFHRENNTWPPRVWGIAVTVKHFQNGYDQKLLKTFLVFRCFSTTKVFSIRINTQRLNVQVSLWLAYFSIENRKSIIIFEKCADKTNKHNIHCNHSTHAWVNYNYCVNNRYFTIDVGFCCDEVSYDSHTQSVYLSLEAIVRVLLLYVIIL